MPVCPEGSHSQASAVPSACLLHLVGSAGEQHTGRIRKMAQLLGRAALALAQVRGIAIARNWMLLATATWHALMGSCHGKLCQLLNFSTTRSQRDIEKSYQADTFSINSNKGPEIVDLGTKGSSAVLLWRGKNSKCVENGFRGLSFRLPSRHKLSSPTIGVTPERICRPRPKSLDLRLLLRRTRIAFLSAALHLHYQ